MFSFIGAEWHPVYYTLLCGRLEGVTKHTRVMALLPMALWFVGHLTVASEPTSSPWACSAGSPLWEHRAREIRPTVISSTPSELVDWAL